MKWDWGSRHGAFSFSRIGPYFRLRFGLRIDRALGKSWVFVLDGKRGVSFLGWLIGLDSLNVAGFVMFVAVGGWGFVGCCEGCKGD